MAKNIPEAVRIKPPPLAPTFRGIGAMGSLRNRRRNASVSEHFTLNKSRINCAERLMQFMMGANQWLARTGVSRELGLSPPKKILINPLGRGLRNPGPSLDSYRSHSPQPFRHGQVISELADATTMSMLGPVTCRALTVIDPLVPPDELVCWLMMTLMPPGSETERFGFETSIDWPATVNPTS
jgi:hypothetical protein